jgi:hypothetical protein
MTEVSIEKASLEKLNFDALYLKYEMIVVNDFCEVEMLNAFRDYCVTCGSYKDEGFKEHLFGSVDEFRSLPQDLKHQFEIEYNTLEIDVETLKKLPEVTPSPGFGV